MKTTAYSRILFWSILLTLALLPLLSSADSIPFGLSCGNAYIEPQTVGKNTYLFLPGSWNGALLTLHTGHEEGIRINGELYRDGESLPCPEEGKLTWQKEGKRNKSTLTVLTGSRIPSLFISCDSQDYTAILHSKEEKVSGSICCFSGDGEPDFSGKMEYLKTRGNSTFAYAKKAYQIKLPKKFPLLGLNKAKKFILLADYNDISLLRNRITLEMAKAVGLPFAIDCLHVDLYINGSYAGVYLLCEKIEVSPVSVAIHDLEEDAEQLNPSLETADLKEGEAEGLSSAKWYEGVLEPDDISGGYLLETDKSYRVEEASEASFVTEDGMAVYIKSPEHAAQKEVEYIGQRVSAFHRAILNRNGIDEKTGLHYSSIIDVESFALKFIIEEFCKNYDALRGSQFFYKDAGDGPIYACSAWDYDLSYGDIYTEHFKAHALPNYFYLANYTTRTGWWNNLLAHSDFMDKVKELYQSRFLPVLDVLLGNKEAEQASTLRSIASYREEIEASANMNFKRWGRSKYAYQKAGDSFGKGVDYLQTFIQKRIKFLSENWIDSPEK